MADPRNTDDIIDSRDVIARIEELESEREALAEAAHEACSELREEADEDRMADLAETAEKAQDELTGWDEDEGQELAALKALADDADGYCSDWAHGATLIRDSYFTEYAEELAGDIGAIDANAGWPARHIDWEAAADELKQDYTSVDFDGETYWMR